MAASRQAVVAEARTWLGTPYAHQQMCKGAGVDCGMLVGGVAIGAGVITPEFWRARFATFQGYARMPANGMLERICRSFMSVKPLAEMEPGDVLVMRFEREPHHLAIVADHPAGGFSIIHALAKPGEVVEHGLDFKWRARVMSCFAMPGVN
jgi:NlpC/P60 family putative phage cell wall peptidase